MQTTWHTYEQREKAPEETVKLNRLHKELYDFINK